MALDNRNTRPLRKRLYVPIADFNGYSVDQVTGQIRAIGNGTPQLTSVVALNMTGLLTNTANNGVEMCGAIPSDLDHTRTVGCRVVWASNAAAVGSRSLLFEAKYKKHTLVSADGASSAGALDVAATALNTILVAQAPAGVVKTIQRTARGVINANTFTKLDYYWSWLVIVKTITSFAEDKYILGMELDYVPRIFAGRRAAMDGDTNEILGG